MEQQKFTAADGQEKRAYSLTRPEFKALIDNLRLVGDLPRMAITLSNDRNAGLRPRNAPVKDAVERIQEVLGDDHDAGVVMTDLDVLRSDRAEVGRALQRPLESGLHKKAGHVVLGLPTIGAALNDIRGPLANGGVELKNPELMQQMVDQFYDDGVQRLMDSV